MTVSEYFQERGRLVVLCDINELEEMKIGRFLGGLRDEFREKLEPNQNLTYDGACNSALIYEKHEKTRGQHGFRGTRQTLTKSNPPNTFKNIKTVTPKSHTRDKNIATSKDVICFKCHRHGHYKNECPNARAFTQRERTEINSRIGPRAMLVFMDGKEELVLLPTYVVNDLGKMELAGNDVSEDEHIEQVYPEEEVHGLLIRRNFHATPKNKNSQREHFPD